MTFGNQPIHEPRTAKMSSGQSPQDMISLLDKGLSAMKEKMVGFSHCLVNFMLSSASYIA